MIESQQSRTYLRRLGFHPVGLALRALLQRTLWLPQLRRWTPGLGLPGRTVGLRSLLPCSFGTLKLQQLRPPPQQLLQLLLRDRPSHLRLCGFLDLLDLPGLVGGCDVCLRLCGFGVFGESFLLFGEGEDFWVMVISQGSEWNKGA